MPTITKMKKKTTTRRDKMKRRMRCSIRKKARERDSRTI